MRLTVQDVAKLLNVSEKEIHKWVKSGDIPSYRLKEQYRFSKSEIIEWAATRHIKVSHSELSSRSGSSKKLPSVLDAIASGGVFYDVEGDDVSSVLRSVVDLLKLPEDVDRKFLHKILLAREKAGSTGVGEGIAIPHVRNPIILNDATPIVALCFLKKQIDFGAVDGVPVSVLFTIISPTIQIHLHLLSRLSFLLHDKNLKSAIQKKCDWEKLSKEFERVESGLAVTAPSGR